MEKPREEWEKEVEVNLWGAINCVDAVLPHMIERGSGSIVCLGSDAGRMGEFREAVYSACKAAVIALSKSIARETGRYGLRVNVVCPGLVAPPEEEPISGESMWNQMRYISPTTCESGLRDYLKSPPTYGQGEKSPSIPLLRKGEASP